MLVADHGTRAPEKVYFIDNPLGRIHWIIVMMRWTDLAPWEFEPLSFSHATFWMTGTHELVFCHTVAVIPADCWRVSWH